MGIVVDNVGVVPGVTVTATHVNTGTTTRAVTNDQGAFRLVSLQPGRYTVKVTMQGFKQLDIAEFFLSAGEVRELGRQTLTGVTITETVNTTAETSPVQTTSSSLQKNVTSDLLTGGQRESGDFAAWNSGRNLSVNGGHSLNRNTTIDGVPVGEQGGNGTTSITPNIDAIQEIRERDRFGAVTTAGGERYARVERNPFNATADQPLSTFGADVDTASYANVRRFLSRGQLPPSNAVRVEELINYFRFDYADPLGGRPIGLTTEIGECPWAPGHKLVLIGAKAKRAAPSEIEESSTSLRPGRNIVLLIDVSGSMAPPERLPLIKTALAQFVDTLEPDDRIAIVTYAGSSGLALPSTSARDRQTIQDAIARLTAGGSTNGASGIVLAYRLAREAYIPGGVNRVILATDGDFNVGVTSNHDLWNLIEHERRSGVFLSVFGVGSGNLNDAMMEQLADRGNGHYSYLDSLQEARRVLVREGGATLETVAKDVKFQVEFNPAQVAAWRLIGYENRGLAAQDFNDDRKDAGEMGAGHTVTVLYEVVPAGSLDAGGVGALGERSDVDPLKYQPAPVRPAPRRAPAAGISGDWLTVKVRYKAPDSEDSQVMDRAVRIGTRAQHLPLASAVAEFGLLLRNNARSDEAWDALSRRVNAIEAPRAMIADKEGFADLVGIAAGLSKRR